MSATKYVVVSIPPTDDGFATRVFGTFHTRATAESFMEKVEKRLGDDDGSVYVRTIHRPNIERAVSYAQGNFDS